MWDTSEIFLFPAVSSGPGEQLQVQGWVRVRMALGMEESWAWGSLSLPLLGSAWQGRGNKNSSLEMANTAPNPPAGLRVTPSHHHKSLGTQKQHIRICLESLELLSSLVILFNLVANFGQQTLGQQGTSTALMRHQILHTPNPMFHISAESH